MDRPDAIAAAAALARRIRRHVVTMTSVGRAAHVGSGLSSADLLAVLYSGILRVNPAVPDASDRDRFILSKGHGCAALYAALAEREFFPLDWLPTFYQNGSRLAGHVTHKGVPGVDASTGSLGHGLGIACGMALAGGRDDAAYRVFALLSDGECDEGSTWEAVLFAPHHRLDNLVAIVDYNKSQGIGRVADIVALEPLVAKWQAFGWEVREIDGHDLAAISAALTEIPARKGSPTCVIAHTIKGKGVSFMEDRLEWHYRNADPEERARALAELGDDA